MKTKFMQAIVPLVIGLFVLGTTTYAQQRDAVDTRTSHPVMEATAVTKEDAQKKYPPERRCVSACAIETRMMSQALLPVHIRPTKSTTARRSTTVGWCSTYEQSKCLCTPDIDSGSSRLSGYGSRNFRVAAQFNAAN